MKNTNLNTTINLPQALDLEQALLGALILERDAYYQVAELLQEDSFYDARHRIVFKSIKELVQAGSPVDMVLVTQNLKNSGTLDSIGGASFLVELSNKVVLSHNIIHYARIIHDKWIARELVKITNNWNQQAQDEAIDVDDLLAGLQGDLVGVMENGVTGECCIADGLNELRGLIEQNQKSSGITGIGTGLFKLDNFTGGLQPSDLIILAAESGQGKTSLGLTIIKNAVVQFGAKAAIYSLEMSTKQLTARLVSSETNIPAKKLLNQALPNNQVAAVAKATKQMMNMPIYFDEKSTSTIDQICNSIRRLKLKHGVNLILVDYLQLITVEGKGKTEESQIAYIARRLKNIAKELNITVIALSQLSRDKDNSEPRKSRLRGSGQIEEAADIVILLWRPEEYGIEKFPSPYEKTDTQGLAMVLMAKGRNIGVGSFLLRFNAKTTAFSNYTPEMPDNVAKSAKQTLS